MAESSLTIALIRHGDYHQPNQVPSAMLPYGLNAAGETHAKAAAQTLAVFADQHQLSIIKQFDSSLMRRAWQTASIITEQLSHTEHSDDFHIKEFPELAERSVGAVANLTVDEISLLLKQDPRYEQPPKGWKSNSEYCLPFQGAESLMQAGERVAEHIRRIWQQHQETGGLKVIVAHGASIRHAAGILGIMPMAEVAKVSMFHGRPVFIRRLAGNWKRVAGEWKPRRHQGDSDEYKTDLSGTFWPVKIQAWPASTQAFSEPDENQDDLHRTQIAAYVVNKTWAWSGRVVYFVCDIHADTEAFFLSLIGAGGIYRTGSGDTEFELSEQGKNAKFIIGGDCFDKGPNNLRLLDVIHQLYLKGADIELLAGNHDLRTLLGFYYADDKSPQLDHLFARMGRKTVPLIKEIYHRFVEAAEVPDITDAERRLYPSESWYQTYPAQCGPGVDEKTLAKELRRIREKSSDLQHLTEAAGLNHSQVYACVEKFRALFFAPTGRYYWFFQKMKLAHREGAYLFVHAGLDDGIAAKIKRSGISVINDEFHEILSSNPAELYRGDLGNVFRTKYRPLDFPYTNSGTASLHDAGIYALVHGHRNILRGQRMLMRKGMLNFECDATVDINTRALEGLKGPGGAVLKIDETGLVQGFSTDYPYIKQFRPDVVTPSKKLKRT